MLRLVFCLPNTNLLVIMTDTEASLLGYRLSADRPTKCVPRSRALPPCENSIHRDIAVRGISCLLLIYFPSLHQCSLLAMSYIELLVDGSHMVRISYCFSCSQNLSAHNPFHFLTNRYQGVKTADSSRLFPWHNKMFHIAP